MSRPDFIAAIRSKPDKEKKVGLKDALIELIDEYLKIKSEDDLSREDRTRLAKLRSHIDIHMKGF